MLISILILKTIDSTQKSKKVSFSVQFTSIQKVYFKHDFFLLKDRIPALFLSFQNIINLFDIYIYIYIYTLLNLYFYTTRSITMFLKVLNKVNFRVCTHTLKFFIIDLLPFAKLLELLGIHDSLCERRIVFVHQLLKFSHVLVVL